MCFVLFFRRIEGETWLGKREHANIDRKLTGIHKESRINLAKNGKNPKKGGEEENWRGG